MCARNVRCRCAKEHATQTWKRASGTRVKERQVDVDESVRYRSGEEHQRPIEWLTSKFDITIEKKGIQIERTALPLQDTNLCTINTNSSGQKPEKMPICVMSAIIPSQYNL